MLAWPAPLPFPQLGQSSSILSSENSIIMLFSCIMEVKGTGTQQFAYCREPRDLWLLFTIVGLLEAIGLALI